MKKIFLIPLLLFLFNNILKAQETCGHETYLNKIYNDSIAKTEFDSIRSQIRAQIQKNIGIQPKFVLQTNSYVIPVVFHLIGGGVSSTLTDAQVQTQLTILNDGFSNNLGSTFGVADDAQIRFCLAQTAPSGAAWATFGATTNGITRFNTALANTITNNHNMDATGAGSQQQLSQVAYFNPAQYLNIWVVNSIALTHGGPNVVLGYAPFPLLGTGAFIDGIVMRLDAFGLNSSNPRYNQGRVLVHEAGHYLGLFHTFQFGCAGTTPSNCTTSGDECCDTPPVFSANQNDCAVFAATTPNSCIETPTDLPDMYENHMDYAWDPIGTCRNTFTDNQVDRMHATIQLFRNQLVSFSNLIARGLTNATGCLAGAVSPAFVTNLTGNSTQVCVNQPIGFIASAGATTYNWSFPGGTPANIVGTNLPTNIIYTTPGLYDVTLNITDGLGNVLSSTSQIFVTSCTPYSGNKANWYFGNHASLSFNTGIGVAQNPSAINTLEASAAISNATGNLLLYTDGRSVWNSTHNFFTNGNNTLNGSPNGWVAGSNISSSQGVVIVPRPTNPNRFFIYTTSDRDNSMAICNGISQYEVDASSLPGNVLAGAVAAHPLNNYAVDESIIAIPHCNGIDYWLISKPRNNTQAGLPNPGTMPLSATINQYFASYLINAIGISNVPILSDAAPLAQGSTFGGGNDGITQMAVSPDKKFICFGDAGSGSYLLYYFDCSSGFLNYITTLPGTFGYGIAFSQNSKVLYTKSGNSIIQYDLANVTQCQAPPTFRIFPTGFTGFSFGSLQLGPDGRIYVSYNLQNTLGVINFPNVINASNTSNDCGYNAFGIPLLAGQIGRLDLPNDIIGQLGSTTDDFTFSIRNCNEVCLSNLGCGNNFVWNFGDGNSISGVNSQIPLGTNGGSTTGNFEYPHHIYSAPGTYNITLSIDGRPVITHPVTIASAQVPLITGPNPVCSTSNGPFSYFAPGGLQYSWSATNTSPSTGNMQQFDVAFTAFPAVINLVVIDPNGCSNNTSITITQATVPPIVNAGADVTICLPSATQLNGTTNNGSITWSPATGLSCTSCLNPIASPGVTTTYILTSSNGCGTTTDQVVVTVTNCNPCSNCPNALAPTGVLSTNPPANQVYCLTNNMTISGNVTISQSEVKISPNVVITVPANSVLNIVGSHLYSCTDMWQGIVIEPKGSINILPYIVGNTTQKTSLIEDAEIAVDVQTGNGLTTNILTSNNATFNKNHYGIRIQGYTLNLTPYPFTIINSLFTCRDIPFTINNNTWPLTSTVKAATNPITSPLQTPYINNTTYSPSNANAFLKNPLAGQKSQTGIYLNKVGNTINPGTAPTYYEIAIGTTGANNYNVFDNHLVALYGLNTNVKIANSVFQNAITTGKAGTVGGIGIQVLSQEINNNRLQVVAANAAGIFFNKFFNCSRSILSQDYFENIIKNNDFRSTQINPAPATTLFQPGKYGITITSCRYRAVTVTSNKLYNIENPIAFSASVGFFNVGSGNNSGQYSGQVNINSNTIRQHLPGNTVTSQFVNLGIAISNIVSISNLILIPGTTVNANNNIIVGAYRGIGSANWLKKDVSTNNNNITLVTQIATGTPLQYGIGSSNNIPASQNYINANIITGFNTTYNKLHGIYTSLSSGQIVNCNSTTNTYNGLTFNGNNAPTQTAYNTMGNHHYGFVLDNNGIIGQQGTPTAPCDNTYTGPFVFKTATLNGSSAQNSKMYVRATGLTNPNGSGTAVFPSVAGTDEYSQSLGSLILVSGNPPFIGCSTNNGNGNGNNPINPISNQLILENIVQDQLPLATNPSQTEKINKHQVYRLLKSNPDLMTGSTVLQDFYTNSQPTLRETFVSIETDLSQGDITTGANKVAFIAPQDNIETNYKNFYKAYIKQSTDSLNATDSLQLASIASGCPFADGAVVYQARALYNVVYNSAVTFEDNCPTIAANSRLGNEQNNSAVIDKDVYDVLVYPNPSNGNIFVAPIGKDVENIVITVTDITGKILYNEQRTVTTSFVNFNLNVKAGTYFVTIVNTHTNEKIIKKLIIQ